MATSMEDVRKFRDEFVSCSICLDTLTEPRMLPCLHTFCLSCLIDFVNRTETSGSTACCPHCRADMPQTTEELRALPTNFLVNRLLELKMPSSQQADIQFCDPCKDGSDDPSPIAAQYCLDCQEKLCSECVNAHRKLKISRQHVLVVLDHEGMQRIKEVLKSKQTMCSLHPENKLEMYCETCSVAICMKCCILKHKDHNNIELSDAGDRCRNELVNIIEGVAHTVSRVNDNIHRVQLKRQSVDNQYHGMKAMLEERAQALTREIEDQKNNLLLEIENNYSTAGQALDDITHSEEEIATSLKTFLDFCLQVREEGTNSELVSMADKFRSKALEMQSKASESSSSVNIEFELKPGTTENNTSKKVKSLIGSIQFQQQFGDTEKKSSPYSDETTCTNQLGVAKSPMPTEIPHKQEKKAKQQGKPEIKDAVGNMVQRAHESPTSNPQSTAPILIPKATLCYSIGKKGDQPIQGVVVWNGKLYVARKSSAVIDVYSAGSSSVIPEIQLNVPGLINPADMVVDRKTGYIFVSEPTNSTIFRLLHKANGSHEIMKCPITYKPNTLSFTQEGNLLISATDDMKVLEYSVTWDFIREISTSPHKPHHAIKIANNNYVLALLKNCAYTICRVILDKDFNIQREDQYKVSINIAKHLSIDSRLGLLFVADASGNRVAALRLKDVQGTGLSVIDSSRITQPHRLTVDPTTGNLYVGCLTGMLSGFSLRIVEQKQNNDNTAQQTVNNKK